VTLVTVSAAAKVVNVCTNFGALVCKLAYDQWLAA
jgi:hypothetical protein